MKSAKPNQGVEGTGKRANPTLTLGASDCPMEQPGPSSIRGWSLLFYSFASLAVSGMVVAFLWPDWLESEASVPLPDACFGVGLYVLLLLLLLRPIHRSGATLRSLVLQPTSASQFKWSVSLGLALFAVSVGAFYAVYLPLSYTHPSFAQWWLFEGPFVADWLSGSWYGLANMLNALLIVLLAPLVEEVLFRGLLLPAWAGRWGMRPAVIFSSLIFAVLHLNILGGFVFGVVTALVYLRTRRLLVPLVIHVTHNALAWLLILGETLLEAQQTWTTLADFQAQWWWGALGLLVGVPWLIHLLRLQPTPSQCVGA